MFRTSLALIVSLSLAACGGGSANTTTVQVQSAPNDSGYAWSSDAVVKKSTTSQFMVGDGFLNGWAHSFLRFSLALIPPGAEITDARLVMGQESIMGDPYGHVGPAMRVDQVNLGPAFEISDRLTPLVIQPLGILSFDANIEAKEANVVAALVHAVGLGWASVGFRIRFDQDTNSDGLGDWSRLNNEADDGGSGIRPTLLVTYED